MNSNPYIQHILSQGKEPHIRVAQEIQYPRKIGVRVYETKKEYEEALHDFLNGY